MYQSGFRVDLKKKHEHRFDPGIERFKKKILGSYFCLGIGIELKTWACACLVKNPMKSIEYDKIKSSKEKYRSLDLFFII